MGKILNMFLCILISNLALSYAQSCYDYTFSRNASYATCVSLPVLNFHLHWNYHSNGTVDVAFRHTGSTTSQWVAWALNVRGAGMIGAQAIVAAASSSGGSDNRKSLGAIDFVTGETSAGGASGNFGGSLQRRRNVSQDYLFLNSKPDTGLKLGSDSTGIKYNTHRNIGIILFAFGTLQVFALLLRPNSDNKYRFYWNIYHRSLRYSVITLSIISVYKGLDIMDPEMKWKNAYTGIIISLGIIIVGLEALTWFLVLKRKKEGERTDAGTSGSDQANGI
ncbi:hypothetical protein L1987_40026 [Smallanthus sonchifolius]|uniref:Uncharacterized protein n=1 Tax=Smallanthus sonchifolius TaxID=185202 RepID=A0ACB9GUL5_9ASTR|nr:hypothetical protein L1987_40026 [Smallanthus sonchifolius]